MEAWKHTRDETGDASRPSLLSTIGNEDSIDSRILHTMSNLSNHIKEKASAGELLKYVISPGSSLQGPISSFNIAILKLDVDDSCFPPGVVGNGGCKEACAYSARRLKQNHPARFQSPELFRSAMMLLENFRYRFQVRRFIVELFDRSVLEAIILDGKSLDEGMSSPDEMRD